MSDLIVIEPVATIGSAHAVDGPCALAEGVWYGADADGDGLLYRFDAGALARAAWVCFDLLLDGDELAVFQLQLQAGEHGPAFRLSFGALNHWRRGCACRWRRCGRTRGCWAARARD
jgi:hypothetical protein